MSSGHIEEITSFIEKQIALTKSYSISSRRFIEQYFMRTDPDFDRSKLKPVDYDAAKKIAQELKLERFAIAWIYSSFGHFEINVSIRDVQQGTVLRTARFVSDSYENMLRGVDEKGRAFEMKEELVADIAGIGLTDCLVLVLLGLQFIWGSLALFRRKPDALVEIIWALALILFVFAHIYALGANMDYVQRYIASSGQLQQAESTALEQMYAFLRYGPILVLNGLYYLIGRITKQGSEAGVKSESRLHRCVVKWALPWVLLSAALFGFSFPSRLRLDGIGLLAWISIVPLLLVMIAAKPIKAVFYGVIFGTLQALIINYWLGTYAYITLHLMTIAFVAEFLLFMIALTVLIRLSGKWGFLIVPAAWVVFDYIRSTGILGYPWGIIGTSQYRFLPLIQIASITGVWGVGFVVFLGNAAIAWALAAAENSTSSRLSSGVEKAPLGRLKAMTRNLARQPQVLFPVAAFIAILLVVIVAGTSILLTTRWRLYRQKGVSSATVVLIQQNTDPRKRESLENLRQLMELTDRALMILPSAPDLVAWPEGAFELDFRYWSKQEREKSYWGRIVLSFREYQRELNTWLMTGSQDHEMVMNAKGERIRRNFNSSVLLDGQGKISGFYHKIKLIPFSEYFPLDKEKYPGLYAMFEKYDISDWSIGEERYIYQHERMRIATPICFEDTFPDHVRRFVLRDVDIILNMSNDYWSLSPVEGRQHGLLSLFRAVENRRPVLRTTSSGYTVYIDALGRVQPGAPEPYTEGYTIARVPLPEKRLTLYTRWGDWFPLAALFAVLAFAAGSAVSRAIQAVRCKSSGKTRRQRDR